MAVSFNSELKSLYRDLAKARRVFLDADPASDGYATRWHDLEIIAYCISDITGEHVDDLTL